MTQRWARVVGALNGAVGDYLVQSDNPLATRATLARRGDKLPQHAGDNTGPRPKPLMLSAVAGCIGMEIAGIMEKMRIKIETLEIDVTGELTNDHPKMYKEVHITFKIKSAASDKEKIDRAIHLAVDKYCGVVAMFRQVANVTTEVIFL